MKLRVEKIFETLGAVLSLPRYLGLVLIVTGLMMVLVAWLPNWRLALEAFGTGNWKLLWGLTQSLSTNFDIKDLLILITSAVLAGIQAALVTYYLRQKLKLGKEAGLGIAGILGSIVGVGCASCGSVFLTSIVGLSASSAVFTNLPLNGAEIGLGGMGILLGAVVITANKIGKSEICELPITLGGAYGRIK